MVVVIVTPVGVPVPVIVGRALDTGDIVLDSRFKVRNLAVPAAVPIPQRPGVYLESGGARLYPNGTVALANGTVVEAGVYWGVMDPR